VSRPFDATDTLAVNTLRGLAIDMIERSRSGHPGLPLGAAPMAWVLWSRHLRFDPAAPGWPDRDRFVLSAGHGSALLYGLLHLFGYDLTLADLQAFRQWGSRTPGHPEYRHTAGVEATTGPLGQGAANAVGLAAAERWLACRCNRPGSVLVDHVTYALVSEGDLMEGVAAEAASLAGLWGLGKLVYLYDANGVTLDAPAALTLDPAEIVGRYEAAGWHVLTVADGDTDLAAIDAALCAARAETARPSLIVVRTTIGFGSPAKAGKPAAHGAPLGPDEARATKLVLGLDPAATFAVPVAVRARAAEAAARGAGLRGEWESRLASWRAADVTSAAIWDGAWAERLPVDWQADLPAWKPGDKVSTRKAGGAALNALASRIPWLLGGDADLASSTQASIKGGGDFDGRTGEGRNLRFGVREHAMGAIANGLAYHGGLVPFVSTFFVFVDYLRPSLRLAALNRLRVVGVFTHDSVAVGEDGPTHQPVEHLASLRAMPGLTVFRPADANETAAAWAEAVQNPGPTVLVLSRQDLPVLDVEPAVLRAGVACGAYVVAEAEGGAPRAIVLATGSEVAVALEARATLQAEGVPVRVVSMPSWERFAAADEATREAVLPSSVSARVSIEAGATFGWARWLGARGVALGIDRFGASAPGERVLAELGMNAAAVVQAVRRLVG
jgi:transketolase